MGQKTPAIGLRIRSNRGFDSSWYQEHRNYSKLFLMDFLYRKYLDDISRSFKLAKLTKDLNKFKDFKNHCLGRVLSNAYPKSSKYDIFFFNDQQKKNSKDFNTTESIGKDMTSLKNTLKARLKMNKRFSQFMVVKNPLEIDQNIYGSNSNKLALKNANLLGKAYTNSQTEIKLHKALNITSSASLLVNSLINSHSKTEGKLPFQNFQSQINKILRMAKEDNNILGIRIKISGRLQNVDRAKAKTFFYGQTPLNQFKSKVDYSSKPVTTKSGLIGIKIWVSYR